MVMMSVYFYCERFIQIWLVTEEIQQFHTMSLSILCILLLFHTVNLKYSMSIAAVS